MSFLQRRDDQDAIYRMAEQATNKKMMLRELVQNAIEATDKQTVGDKRIEILSINPAEEFGLTEYNSSKLAIFNTGPGMSMEQLRLATDIGVSVGKSGGVHGNFGEGAKLASLKCNKSGMIWISCHNREVSMTILQEGVCPHSGKKGYERRDWQIGRNTSDVLDITSIFDDASISNPCGLTTDEDWTLIILCGNDVTQDTTIDPYGDGKQQTGWALTELYTRFFKFPDDVKITSQIHSKGKSVKAINLKSIMQVLTEKAESELFSDRVQIELVSGITDPIHGKISHLYVHDGPYGGTTKTNKATPTSIISNVATCTTFSGVVYKNELYDVCGANSEGTSAWQVPAKAFGIVYGFKYFRIFTMVEESEKIIPDSYRTSIKLAGVDGHEIKLTDFADSVIKHMPDSFKEKLASYKPDTTSCTAIQELCQQLLDEADAVEDAMYTNSGGTNGTNKNVSFTPTFTFKTASGTKSSGSKTQTVTSGGGNKPSLLPALLGKQKVTRVFPNAVKIYKDFDNVALSPTFKYKAAEFCDHGNTVYINATYPVVELIKERLLSGIKNPLDTDEELAQEHAESHLVKLICLGLTYGMIKKGKIGFENEFEMLTSSACLTTHADNWLSTIGEATREFRAARAALNSVNNEDSIIDENDTPDKIDIVELQNA